MSDHGAYEGEMGRFSRFSDRDLDALMAGKTPAGRGELDDLAAFLRDAAVVFEEAPDGGIESRHLAAIVQSARLLAEHDGLATEPTAAGEPARSPRRKFMSRKLLVPVAVGVLLALSVFGGVAYAGALPGPIQGPVADVVDNLGVSLPGADTDDGAQNDKDDGPVADVDDGAKDDKDDGPVADVDDGAKGDQDDGPVANVDDGAKGDQDDGPVGDKDDGAADDGAEGDKDDGPVADVDDGAKDDKDDGAVEDRDDGAQNDVQDGPQDDVQDGPQGDNDQSQQGDGPSGDSDQGSQGE